MARYSMLLLVLLVSSWNGFAQRGIKFFHHGNELEQFEAYEKMTAQSVNVTEFIAAVDACEGSTVPERGHRSYMCRYKLREQREKVIQPLWHRKSDHEMHRYKVDCRYHMASLKLTTSLKMFSEIASSKYIEGVMEEGSIVFAIDQGHCHTRDLTTLGGSTFEIYLQSTHHLAVCNVEDYFSNRYKVFCPLPSNYHHNAPVITVEDPEQPGKSISAVCSNVSITLHYEHFDAFDDVGHSRFSSLHHRVYHGPVCAVYDPTTGSTVAKSTTGTSDGGSKGLVSTSDSTSSEPLWLIRPPNSEVGQLSRNPVLQNSILGSASASADSSSSGSGSSSSDNTAAATLVRHRINPAHVYEWRGQTAKYLTVSAMKRCLKRQTLWFIGESHMRYQFDITMDRYVDKLKMGRYHGNVNVSGVSYSDNTFSTRLIALLDNLPCAEGQQPQTLVMQTGSWDLQFFPPRAYIRNPLKQAQGVVQAMQRLKQRPHCSSNYHIIWMSIMPHPYCVGTHEHCLRLMNYWRNNGAIRAANQFMERQLTALNYPGLVLLDAPSIALPRFPLNDIVCVDHFLCNDQPRGFVTTPTGIALGNEVLTFSCAQEMNETTTTIGAAAAVTANIFADGALIKMVNSSSTSRVHYYSIEGGCRREFPDAETLLAMGGADSDFKLVSTEYVLDIPVCFRSYFLTRKNATMYQTYSSKSVYYMDSGKRRQMSGVSSLIDLGRDFDEVIIVLEKELDRIPEGPQIKGKRDCNWCQAAGMK